MWVRLLKVPYRLMFPAILMFCCIGIYSINSLPTDVMFIGLFGFVGYVLIKFGFEPAPLLLGFVLGKLMEENLRRALILSRGSLATFVERPGQRGPAGGRRDPAGASRCCPRSARDGTRFSPNRLAFGRSRAPHSKAHNYFQGGNR